MQYYYSATTKGFYVDEIHTDIPSDAVAITEELHTALVEGQCEGRIIMPPDAEHAAPYLADLQPPTLDEAKAVKIRQIDAQTAAAILAGFTYEIDGQALHFSYDTNDQQNFADTANASTLALMGVPGIPDTITWNGWKIEKDGEGKEISRSLVRLNLDPQAFLGLYMGGALTHKATQMEIGGMRKAAVEAAVTTQEVENI